MLTPEQREARLQEIRQRQTNAHICAERYKLSMSKAEQDTDFLLAELKEAEQQLAALQAASRWIPVTEKFPPVGRFVLVVIGRRVQYIAVKWTGEHWTWADDEADSAPKAYVTHWMPLPKAPEAALAAPAPQEEK